MDFVSCPHCGRQHRASATRCLKTGAMMPRPARPTAESAAGPDPRPDGTSRSGPDPFAHLQRSSADGCLVLRLPDGGTIVLSTVAPVVLGRDQISPIAEICGDNVSWRHAEVVSRADGPVLTDLRSTNGTYVNGRPLPPGEQRGLRAGDVVQLANDPPLRLTVMPGGAAEEAP